LKRSRRTALIGRVTNAVGRREDLRRFARILRSS
jgi:hypothetical protein